MKKFLSLFIIVFFTTICIPTNIAYAKQLTLPKENITKLVINSSISKLTVRGISGANSIDSKLVNSINPININFKLTKDRNTAYLSIHPKIETKGLINLVVTLPRNLDIEINDGKSNIELYDIHGKVNIIDDENDIYIENTKYLSIKDKSGDVTINNKSIMNSSSSSKPLIIEDGSGNISLNNINSSVEILDSSGDVNVNNINGDINIKNGSGNIDVKNVSKKVFIDDGSGDINVEKVGELILKDAGSGKVTYDKKKFIPSSKDNSIRNVTEGIYIQKNGGKKVLLDAKSPIDIEPNSNVAISIENYNNLTFNNHHLKSESNSLIPNLIRNVGEGASVTININNSANVELINSLIIGEKNYDANNKIIEQVYTHEPSLINDLIIGKIGSKSTIKINITNSANVKLANNNSTLHIGGGSLIESLINIPSDSNTITTDVKEISVNIVNSSNITSKAGPNMGKLRIYRGQLINEIIDTTSITNSKINVNIDKSGKVSTKSVEIIDGELIDEIVDCEDIKSSEVNVKFIDAANINTLNQVKIEDGELIDEIVDMESNSNAKLNISFLRSSNVNSNILSIYEGELIDETLDGEGYDNSNVYIDFDSSSNFHGKQLLVDNGELIDEVVDGEVFNRSQVRINMKNTSNVTSDELKISSGELIDEAVDIEDKFDNTTMNITMTSTAKVTGNKLEIISGELIDEIVDSAKGKGSNINVFLSDTGNFKKKSKTLSHVSIIDGELMDEILDLGQSLTMVTGNITVNSSANIISDQVTLNNSELMDEIIDGPYTKGSTLNVTVTDSANVKSPSLKLIGDSILLSPNNTNSENQSNVNYHFQNSGIRSRSLN